MPENVIGKRWLEFVPAIDPYVADIFESVIRTGEPVRTENRVENLNRWHNTFFTLSGGAGSNRIICVYSDITDRKNEEEKQTYILKLSDAIKELIDPVDIQLTACRILGEHVKVKRVLYGEVIDEEQIIINNNYVNGVPPINATLDVEQFGRNVLDAFKRNEKVIISDITTDPGYTEEAKQSFLSVDVVANVGMGLVKGGRWVATFGMHYNAPRKWTATEIWLLEETAERTWAAVERAKAEEALRKSEEKYRTLFTSIDQGFAFCELIRNKEGKGIDFYVLEVNSTYEKQAGVSAEMVLGKSILQVFPTLDKWWIETYAAVVDDQRLVVFEQYSEVSQRWLAINAYPGEKDRFAILFSDITERKQAEEKLKETEFRYHEMIYSSPSQICILKGEDLIIEIANDAIIESWGKGKDIIGKSLISVMPEIVEQGFEKLLLSVYKTGEPVYAYETPVTLIRNGKPELMHYTFIYQAQRNVNGEIEGVAIIANEVTPQAELKQQIKESESRFRTMADASPVLIWTLDANGLSAYYNKTFLDFIGVSKNEDISDWKKIVHPDDVKSTFDTINTAIAERRSYSLECRMLRADRQWRWVLAQGNPRIDTNNEFLGFVGSSVDITELKQTEEKLMEAKESAENAVKFKQQFLSNMSHEIRTPLNSILGFSNVLLKTELGVEQKTFLQAIKSSSESLNMLINDILDLAKVDAGRMTFEKQPFEIRASIKSILYSFDLKIKEKNLELINEYDSKIPSMLLGDSIRFNQIILNLISNAVKFTHKGKITLSVKLLNENEENVSIEFAVSDSGIGIAANKINSIFNLYEQAELSTANSYGGTGLGLAIVKQLIETQGGSISVKSKIGAGSTFSFILPFGKTNIKSKEEKKILKPDPKIENLRVLVAEDIKLNQLLIKIVLSEFGFEYEIVGNGKRATEKLQTNTYDIVLMDLHMPEMNGFEATEYIRKTMKSQIPIIALTADVTTADVSKCKEFGMDGYISKPINENLLYSKIVELVKKKQ